MLFDLKAEAEQLGIPTASVSDDAFRVYLRRTTPDSIEIAIDDEIGDDGYGGGVRAEDVAAALAESPSAAVTVRINSPGGLAYDGIKIYNLLANHSGHVTTINEGLAYSAGSVIFMAGDTRQMYQASDFGIHRSSGGGYGTQYLVAGVAKFLGGLDNHLIEIYASGTGRSHDQITAWLDGTTKGTLGTMFSGSEAVEAGFADTLIPNKPRSAEASGEIHQETARNLAMRNMIETRKRVARELAG